MCVGGGEGGRPMEQMDGRDGHAHLVTSGQAHYIARRWCRPPVFTSVFTFYIKGGEFH